MKDITWNKYLENGLVAVRLPVTCSFELSYPPWVTHVVSMLLPQLPTFHASITKNGTCIHCFPLMNVVLNSHEFILVLHTLGYFKCMNPSTYIWSCVPCIVSFEIKSKTKVNMIPLRPFHVHNVVLGHCSVLTLMLYKSHEDVLPANKYPFIWLVRKKESYAWIKQVIIYLLPQLPWKNGIFLVNIGWCNRLSLYMCVRINNFVASSY